LDTLRPPSRPTLMPTLSTHPAPRAGHPLTPSTVPPVCPSLKDRVGRRGDRPTHMHQVTMGHGIMAGTMIGQRGWLGGMAPRDSREEHGTRRKGHGGWHKAQQLGRHEGIAKSPATEDGIRPGSQHTGTKTPHASPLINARQHGDLEPRPYAKPWCLPSCPA
jgi:hypothetical protein